LQKRVVSYHEYGVLIEALTKKLKDVNIDYICGIPRGGLPIAVHISHYLEKPMVSLDFLKNNWLAYNNVLLVDDIIDTGKTINDITNYCDDTTFVKASLFKRPGISIDFYVCETPNWIVFPYEKYEEKPSEYHQEVYSDFFCEGK